MWARLVLTTAAATGTASTASAPVMRDTKVGLVGRLGVFGGSWSSVGHWVRGGFMWVFGGLEVGSCGSLGA